MKKTLYILSISAALLAAGCNKTEQPACPSEPQTPAEESGIVILTRDINSIEAPDAKTVTEEKEGKFTVNWADGDQIAVYTLPSGSNLSNFTTEIWQASQPVQFKTEASAEDGLRVFTLNETATAADKADSYAKKVADFKERHEAGNLDWYAIYPGVMDSPSHAGKGMVSFGVEPKGNVVQNGNDNMAHLSGHDVLFGKAYDTKTPTIEMKHLGTLMEFAVTNGTEEAFTVKAITVNTSEVIAGEFRLHLTEDQPLDKTDGFNQSGVCTLEVKDAEPVGAGEKAKFYQVFAPFALAAGKSINIIVKTDKGDWSRTMTVGKDGLAFEAGKKYTSNLNVTNSIKEVKTLNLGIWNNPEAKFGPYLNLKTGGKYAKGDEEGNYAGIDLIALYVNGGPKLTAPGDEWTFQNVTGMEDIRNWPVRNKTLLKNTNLTENDYNAVKDAFEIKKIYNEAEGAGSTSLGSLTNVNAKGKVYAAMTANGRYALIYYVCVNGWSNEKNEYMTLNMKIEE